MTSNPWIKIGLDAWWLTMEASSVIALRTLKLASGGASAAEESQRMVTEKIAAALTLGPMLIASASAAQAMATALNHYRRKTRANRKRLTKI